MQEARLRRMVSAIGNAIAKNLFRISKVFQYREGIHSAEE